jgi:hypothetical protein
MNKWDKLFWLDRWVDETTLNLRHQKKNSVVSNSTENNTLTYGTDIIFRLKKRYNLSLGGNLSTSVDDDLTQIKPVITQKGDNTSFYTQTVMDIKKWRLSVRYDYAKNYSQDGTGKPTQDLTTHTGTIQTNADMAFPKGLPIPFTKRTLPLTNRLVFTSSLKYVSKASSLNVATDNTDMYNLNSNADYEVSSNFRAAMGLGYGYLMNRYDSDQNYSTIEASLKLTIQF